MSVTLDDLAAGTHEADFKRDRWGRPNIMQPDGKRKAYTRCSSAAKTVEDTYNLEKWARRNIAYGMAYDASLVARVIAIGGEPSTWGKAEKDAVNEILDAADAVAKAHKRADMGTAVHHMTHRVDRGETVNAGPYQADIDAYTAALKAAHLTVDERYIECRMVNDDLEMAGTADRIIYTGTDFVIADIKTGATIDYGGLGWSAQEAAYAGGLLYDVTTEQRIHTPPIDRNVGLIIHLPAGEGRCDIYEVDIAQGLVAAKLANDIRATRKAAKKWITPITKLAVPSSPAQSSSTGSGVSSLSPGPVDEPNWRFEAKRRYDLLNDDQRAEYTARKAEIDTSDPIAVFALLDEVEPFAYCRVCDAGGHECPGCGRSIPHGSFQCTTNCVDEPPPVRPFAPDEGGSVAPATIAALRTAFEALPDAAQLWISTLTAQGKAAGVDWRTNIMPSLRRYELGRAAVRLADRLDALKHRRYSEPDELVNVIRGLLQHATGLDEPGQETTPLGAAIGLLNADEAVAFAAAVDEYVGGLT